jgi:hypothetical protein
MKRLTAGVGLLATFALASPALASTYTQLLHVYQQTGSIAPCSFSSAELQGVLNSTDTYEAQYFADFTNAIRAALAQRAAGACAPKPPAAHVGGAASTAPLRLGPVIAGTSSSVPAPIVLLAILGSLFLLAGAIAATARVRGWDPAWAAAFRHSWNEAEFRLGATWHEFVDWVRSRD